MDLSKKAQLEYRQHRKKPKVTVSEDALQVQCNDNLDAYGKRLKWIRIPDWLWVVFKNILPIEAINCMSKYFGGMPDNVIFAPIGNDYNLCLAIELKTEAGKLHGKQKTWSKDINVKISRSTETTEKLISDFIETVKACNKAMEKEGF